MHRDELQSRFSAYFSYPGRDAAENELVFLRDRTSEDWRRLLEHAEVLRFEPGDVVIRAGERDRALYIVASGTLEVLLQDERGAEHPFGTIEPRSVSGEVAFLDGRPRSATIRALTPTELLRLSFESYETLAARYPELGRAILADLGRIVAARLRQASAVIAQTRLT